MKIKGTTYGKLKSGDRIDIVTVSNSSDVSFSVISYGATLVSVKCPDKNGHASEITLGKKDLSAYEAGHPFFGSTAGRVCNRIAGGRFSIDGNDYQLPLNDGPNCLHGGPFGFDKAVWEIFPFKEDKKAGVRFFYTSEDGEQGFPGNLEVSVSYTLTEDSKLIIDYEAASDKATPVNLTNHVYWNLGETESGDVRKHKLLMNCDSYLPVDDLLIPTGEIRKVTDTPFDFLETREIGSRIEEAGGYDHCFVTSNFKKNSDAAAETETTFPVSGDTPFAVLSEEKTGRRLDFFTTQPGVQLYTGNFLENEQGRSCEYQHHAGICLETQNFPDAVNHDNFPSSVLRPGKKYRQQTIIHFGLLD